MSVTFITANSQAATSSDTSWTHTPAGVPNFIAALVAYEGTLGSATYGGVAMTLGPNFSTGNTKSGIFYLVNPASGGQTVRVLLDTATRGFFHCFSFDGVYPGSPILASTTANWTSSDVSVALASHPLGMLAAVGAMDDSTNGVLITSGQTMRTTGQWDLQLESGAATAPGTGSSVTMSFFAAGPDPNASMCAISLNAAPAGNQVIWMM